MADELTTRVTLLTGDCREEMAKLAEGSVHMVCCSPPYFSLRDYQIEPTGWDDGWVGCLGLEPEVGLYVAHLVECLEAVRRVLRKDGTCFVNLGDTYARDPKKGQHKPGDSGKQAYLYDRGGGRAGATGGGAGLKEKDLCLVPARVAMACQEAGWWLRQMVVWEKPNAMPSSVKDRPAMSHEFVLMLTRSAKYYHDASAIREPHGEIRVPGNKSRQFVDRDPLHAKSHKLRPSDEQSYHPAGRTKRSVWRINAGSYRGDHFAVMPDELVEICIKCGSSEKGCCANCGAPYARLEGLGEPDALWQKKSGGGAAGEYNGVGQKSYAEATVQNPSDVKRRILAAGTREAGGRKRHTLSWQKTCRCDTEEVRPAVVLDPFAGSGTTALVARRLGRECILIDAQPEYRALQEERISPVAVAAKRRGQLALFEESGRESDSEPTEEEN